MIGLLALVHAALEGIADAFCGDAGPNVAEGLVDEALHEIRTNGSSIVVFFLKCPSSYSWRVRWIRE